MIWTRSKIDLFALQYLSENDTLQDLSLKTTLNVFLFGGSALVAHGFVLCSFN